MRGWEEGRVIVVDEGGELSAEECSFGKGFGREEHLAAEGGFGGGMGVGAEGGEDFESVGGGGMAAEEVVGVVVGGFELGAGFVGEAVGGGVYFGFGGCGEIELVLGDEDVGSCEGGDEGDCVGHAVMLVADCEHFGEPRREGII